MVAPEKDEEQHGSAWKHTPKRPATGRSRGSSIPQRKGWENRGAVVTAEVALYRSTADRLQGIVSF